MAESDDVLGFWMDAGPEMWFSKNDDFDRTMSEKFGGLYKRAVAGELDDWADKADSALALILVLDQFSRNMFREDARAFAQDFHALAIAKSSIALGHDQQVDPSVKQFFYMPLMHSESIKDQQQCVRLFHIAGLADNMKYAIIHRDIIARFGKFPHRNKVVGRPTSRAEQAYLESGGFSG